MRNLHLLGSVRQGFSSLRDAREFIARRGRHPKDESGAILILALVFLVAVSLIVLGLLSWSGASLRSTTAFGNERAVEYAATSAVDLAIQNTRYSFDSQFITNTMTVGIAQVPTPAPCLGSGVNPPSFTEGVNGTTVSETIDVYCTMTWNPSSSETRIITYSACPTSDDFSASQCTQTPLLQAVVSFDDYAGITSPPPDCDSTTNESSCGLTMAQLSWAWRPVAPTVSSLTNGSGPINGGSTLQINGSGFVSGSTVNFIEESGGTPSTDVAGFFASLPTSSSAGCQPPSCLLVATPAITEGADYYVTVTTPGAGTSLEVSNPLEPDNAVFVYAAVPPTLTSISGSIPSGQSYVGGSITGGTVVTITGTGFVNGTGPPTVNFICASLCTAGSEYQANSTLVDVESDTSMTVVSPDQTTPSAGTYYLQVITVDGSAGSSSNDADLYDYTTQVPIVTGVGNNNGCGCATGAAGSTITVSGGNFLGTSSVAFVEESAVSGITTTNNSPNVSTTGSFSNVAAGWLVTGNGIPNGASVLSVNSTTSITLSANATANVSGTSTLTFTSPSSIPGTSVSVPSATSLQVTTPASTPAATTYFVVVSWTSSGTTYTSQTYNVTSSNPDGDVFTFTNT